jgi:prolipoprotein diacylglyceryltransferase
VPRFPTQVIGVIWSLIAFVLVWAMAERNRRWPAGARGLYALSLVALGAFFLAFTRGDPMPLINGLRLDVIGSALVLVIASVLWGWLVSRKSPILNLQPPTSNVQPPTSNP